MHTLVCAPSTVLAGMQLRSALHSSPFGHAGAQYESPPSCTQLAPAQSASVTQSTQALPDASPVGPPEDPGASLLDVAHATSVTAPPTTRAAPNASAWETSDGFIS